MSTREEIEALGFTVPDSIEPVVAYRSWSRSGFRLSSHNSTPWTPGEALKAGCMHGTLRTPPHDAPVNDCTCGIYAAKAEEVNRIVPCQSHFVFGEVYLWGRVKEHMGGYRAEYAYPKQFFVLDEITKGRVEALGFGVPVTVVSGVYPGRFPFPDREYQTPAVPQGWTVTTVPSWGTVNSGWNSGFSNTGHVASFQSSCSCNISISGSSGGGGWTISSSPPEDT